ncbi:MAG: nuclear transport factor 2 family protein [Anaerolineales bacterium]|nr:nuclear transport factor 2 family protein [Anaerolineales bacterium]MDW8162196.1 nuclear transport factor 2 family protein [Anaerolineales bacterium]
MTTLPRAERWFCFPMKLPSASWSDRWWERANAETGKGAVNLQGKGYFIWKIWTCEGGDVNAIAGLAQKANLTYVLVKVADGTQSYNFINNVDLVPPLVDALRQKGILVWGWHYLYGNEPVSEADRAIQRIGQLDLDGYALDVEREFKQPGKDTAARTFMRRLRSAYPSLPIALCSYRYPSYHPQVPWREFLEQCDYNMPQVYWERAHNPADQLRRSVMEFQALSPFRPVLPVGSAYRSGDWAPSPSEVLDFLLTAQALGLSAVSFWEWSNTRKHLPQVWQMVHDYPWALASPAVDITEQLVEALNTRNPDSVLAFYLPDAVHVNAARTIQGAIALRAWYESLLTQLLPNATFTHLGYNGRGSARWFSWRAVSPHGRVENGSDTLAIYQDKIAYHYTSFTILPP